MCRMMYVYTTLSSLALSSQPVCAWVGWHRCLTVCTYAHIVQTIAPHLLSLLLLLYILYNIYTTTIDIPNMIFVYIILCHVKRLCYTPTLGYITLCYTMCIYALSYYDIWPWIITSYTILIYYNNYYYDNCNSYLFYFLFLLLCFVYVYACMCCAVLSLSCVCMCALLCILAYAHTCVSVCVFTPHHPPRPCCSEEANVLI